MENFKADRTKAYRYNYRAETLDSLRMAEPFDKPTKFHVSAQMESTAMQLQTLRATDRIQAGQIKRTQEMPIHDAVDEYTPWQHTTQLTLKEKDKAFKKMNETSKIWSEKVIKTVPSRTQYITPMETSTRFQEEVRRQKALNIFETTKGVFAPPIQPVDRATLKNRFAVEKPIVRVSTAHSGLWEVSIRGCIRGCIGGCIRGCIRGFIRGCIGG